MNISPLCLHIPLCLLFTLIPLLLPSHQSPGVTFTEHIVYKAMKQAKRSYSVGPDGIPSIFWANLAFVLALPVSVLFGASYHFAIVPSDWKRAHVTPLFKQGNAGSVANYRPISLTCTLGKIMESIIRDNLCHIMNGFCF
jgi:hypothetical protein